MKRKDDGLTLIREILSELPTPVKPAAKPQAVHPFTRFNQVNQLVGASEADLGFMARLHRAYRSQVKVRRTCAVSACP